MRPTSHWLRPTYKAAAIVNRYDCGIFVCAPASTYKCGIIWSPDMGKTWAQYDLKEFGARSGCRINKKNTDGWFRMDLRKGWIERAEVIFLKPKPAAKN